MKIYIYRYVKRRFSVCMYRFTVQRRLTQRRLLLLTRFLSLSSLTSLSLSPIFSFLFFSHPFCFFSFLFSHFISLSRHFLCSHLASHRKTSPQFIYLQRASANTPENATGAGFPTYFAPIFPAVVELSKPSKARLERERRSSFLHFPLKRGEKCLRSCYA